MTRRPAPARALAAAMRGVRRRRAYPEQKLQVEVIEWLRLALIPPATVWFCPNGVNLPPWLAGLLQRMGLLAGVHDLHVIYPRANGNSGYGTLELKAGSNTADPEQEAFGLRMTACGHRWALCRSLSEVDAALRDWGVPLRSKPLDVAA